MKAMLAIGVLLQTAAASQTESCNPATASAANVRTDDAGQVWVGDLPLQDSNAVFDVTASLPMQSPPPPMPARDNLCMLSRGNLTGKGNGIEGWEGVWIGDIREPWFLGPPNSISKRSGAGGTATTTYVWLKPGAFAPIGEVATVTLMLTYEWAPAYSGRAGNYLRPLTDPFFLIDMSLQDTGQYPSVEYDQLVEYLQGCWDPTLQVGPNSTTPRIPCVQCMQRDRDYGICDETITSVPEECFTVEL